MMNNFQPKQEHKKSGDNTDTLSQCDERPKPLLNEDVQSNKCHTEFEDNQSIGDDGSQTSVKANIEETQRSQNNKM